MTANVVDYNLYFAPGGGKDGTWIWKSVDVQHFCRLQGHQRQ